MMSTNPASQHLSVDQFLAQLPTLFTDLRTKTHGSVYLTQKRLTPHTPSPPATDAPLPPSTPFPDLHPPHPLPILIRATNGKSRNKYFNAEKGKEKKGKEEKKVKKVKLSCVVQAEELEGFFERYAEVWKRGMEGLKKRDRSGRKGKGKGKGKKGKGAEKEGKKG